MQTNDKLAKLEPDIVNGVDETINYPLPKFEPFFYLIYEEFPLKKSKYF